jgi:hypothetical protein
MAKFTSFDAPIGTPGPISVRRATGEDFGGSQGLTTLGAGLEDFGALLAKRQEQSAGLFREETIADDRVFLAQRYQQLTDELPNGGEGIFAILQREMEARGAEQAALQKTKQASHDYLRQFEGIKGLVLGKAIGTEAAAVASGERKTYTRLHDLNVNAILADPSDEQLEIGLAQMGRLVGNLTVGVELQDRFIREFTHDLYAAQADGLLAPERVRTSEQAEDVLERIETGVFKSALKTEDYDRVLGIAQRFVEHYRDRDAAEFEKDVDQWLRAIRHGVPGVPLTQADIDAAVTDPKDHERLSKALADAITIGEERIFINDASPLEIAKHLETLTAARDRQGGEDFDAAVARLAAFERAVADRSSEIEADRAAYVLEHSPVVHDLYKQYAAASAKLLADDTPKNRAAVDAARDDYVAAAWVENKRLGILNPYLLHTNEVAAIAALVASVEHSPEGADKLTDMLSAQAGKWGKHWPIVYRQLVEQEAMSGGHIILARIADDIHRGTAALDLAQALSMTRETMHAGKVIDKKTLRKKIIEEASDFYTTLRWQGAARTIENHQNTLYQLSLYYMTQRDMSEDEAVELAFKGLVGLDYNFVGTYRVPVEHDHDLVSAGVEHLRREKLAPLNARGSKMRTYFQLPASARGGLMKWEQYAAVLLDSGRFVTSPGEDGLHLVDEYGRPATGRRGESVFFSFEELMRWGAIQYVDTLLQRKLDRAKRGMMGSPVRLPNEDAEPYVPPPTDNPSTLPGRSLRGGAVRLDPATTGGKPGEGH